MKILKDDEKRYTYNLKNKKNKKLRPKHAYAGVGDTFCAEECILAGTVPTKANLLKWLTHQWDAVAALQSESDVDRFCAAKAFPYLGLGIAGLDALLAGLAVEAEPRVRLEIAAALAKLDVKQGLDELSAAVAEPAEPYLRMEAVLIAAEVGTEPARALLMAVASKAEFQGDEVRQAAVWGLGESGCASYADLVPFIADAEPDVALHAICAFASPLPDAVGSTLVGLALRGTLREQAAARLVLRGCAGRDQISMLGAAIDDDAALETSALATLAMFPKERIEEAATREQIVARLAPMRLLLDERENWLAAKDHVDSIAFLEAQTIHAARGER
jgi:HEAT repeat protein